ncbi:MAG: hypothetical protein ABIQ74_12270 [Chitinophagales bacterium]
MKEFPPSAVALPAKSKNKSTSTDKFYPVHLSEYKGDLSEAFDFNSRLTMSEVFKRERVGIKKRIVKDFRPSPSHLHQVVKSRVKQHQLLEPF